MPMQSLPAFPKLITELYDNQALLLTYPYLLNVRQYLILLRYRYMFSITLIVHVLVSREQAEYVEANT